MTITASSAEARVSAEYDKTHSMLINGQWVSAVGGEHFTCVDPFTRHAWGQVPRGDERDVQLAVAAAVDAFDNGPWPRLAPAERARVLRKIAALIEENADELARVQVLENGKLITEMRGGMTWLARQCEYSAGLAEMISGKTIETGTPNMLTYTVREPVGVVAAITPWNSPLGLLGFKIFPALAAGCTVVIKPSEITPVSTLLLAELCVEAGLPAGTINVVTGFGPAGKALVEHPDVAKVAFTGSTGTGQWIAQTVSDRMGRVLLELGGKSPNIVFDDADLDNAVHGIMGGIFAATGQTCIAGSRVLVQRGIYDELLSRLREATLRLRLGDPLDPKTQVGPVSNVGHLDKVLGYLDIGREEGARVVVGGSRATGSAELDRGLFVEPTVFADVDNSSRLATEEIFGPVAAVIPFDTEDEAINLANATEFGLAAGVWTQDIGRSQRMIRSLRAGTVWVNTYRIGHHYMPFGGVKNSGIGRELGEDCVREFTEVKSVWIDYGNTQPFGR